MNQFKQKMQLVYLPLVVVSALFVIGYTALSWLLFVAPGIDVPEEVAEFYLPAILPWVLLLTILRKRTGLLIDSRGNDKPAFGIRVFAWLVMFGTSVIAQGYMKEATGKLADVEDVTHIDVARPVMYYKLKHYWADWMHPGIYASNEVSGKHNEDLNFYVHEVMPLYASDTTTTDTAHIIAWLGIRYSKRISNSGTEEEKEKQWRAFAEETEAAMNKDSAHAFVYLKRIGNNEQRKKYELAIAEKYGAGEHLILEPINKPFENRTGDKVFWIFVVFAGGSAFLFIFLLFCRISLVALDKLHNGKAGRNEEISEVLEMLIPRTDYFVTPILADLNILVFVVMCCCGYGLIHIDTPALINSGANYGPATTNSGWWRLLTSTFLHGGIMHILSNMVGLCVGGVIIEATIGRRRFLLAYIISGLAASGVSLWWHPNVVSVGASGAIMGIYGLIIALAIGKKLNRPANKALLIFALIFAGYNLIMGLAGGVDNAAHIGGLLCGFVIGGIFLFAGIKGPEEIKGTDVDGTWWEQRDEV